MQPKTVFGISDKPRAIPVQLSKTAWNGKLNYTSSKVHHTGKYNMRVLSKSLPTNHGIIFFSQQCTSKYQNFLQSIVSRILFQITYIRSPAPPMQICSFIKMPSILSFFALLLNFGSQSSLLRFHLTQHHTACCTLFSCICLLLCSVHAVQCNAGRYWFLETDTIFLI